MERVWKVMDEPEPRRRRPGERLLPYFSAFGLVAVGFILHLGFAASKDSRAFVLFFVPAVLAGAVLGGLWPALFATVLGLLSVAVVLARQQALDVASVADVVLFVGLGVVLAFGGERLRQRQHQAEEMNRHVREREAYLQSVLDTVPDAMIVIDDKGVIQSFSPTAERVFGWTAKEVIGRNVGLLMPSPDREAHDSYLERYARTRERHIIGIGRLVTAQRKDGTTFPAELSIGEASAGPHPVFTGFIRDLTTQEHNRLQLQEMQSELIHISRLSAMGEMAAALAHELNQPLSAIANYLNASRMVLQADSSAGKATDLMGKAVEQSLRAGEIIRRLRDFVARGESERNSENLAKVIEEATPLALTGAKERGISVKIERDPAVDRVMIDKIQVQQVLVNLIRNALEAMESGPRRDLTIRISAASPELAQVSVIDTGSGISPDIADRLFQPFVTTKGAQGMGIGLSISRNIIEAQGGRIWVEPNPQGGTIFHLTLPRADREEEV